MVSAGPHYAVGVPDPVDHAAPSAHAVLAPAVLPLLVLSAPVPSGSGAVDQSTAMWGALAALGLREVVLAPGSRSAPLVYALDALARAADGGAVTDTAADGPAPRLRAHVRIDERAAAFTALGLSRHDPAHPAAVVTTSGTATAHLHAAVMEAHHSRIPLLVLTADRPAELREVGANQTTRQAGMFGSLTRFAVDLPAPTATGATEVELRTAVSTAARAWAAATGEHPGPVHLNVSFRDPLVPRPGSATEEGGERPRLLVSRRIPAPAPDPQPVPVGDRTVVVAGDGAGPAAAEIAARHRLPLLAEPSSGARAGETLVPGYPALLARVMADPEHPLRPDRAIVLGHPTLSRPVVSALLGAADVEVIVVDAQLDWPDVARRARLVVPAARGVEEGAPGDVPVADLSSPDTTARREERLAAWRAAAADAAPAELAWQQRAALAVWEAGQAGDTLVLGSSSLVRDLDQLAGPTDARVIANRGLAGIDGTTALAGGIALGAQRPSADGTPGAGGTRGDDAPPPVGRVRLLVGDLTALHDLTGLLIGPEEERPDLDVVVVDDGGGRIFSGLEHAAAPPALLRRFFTTPHGADIAAAAAALGADARVLSPEDLPAALAEPAGGLRVLVAQATHSRITNFS